MNWFVFATKSLMVHAYKSLIVLAHRMRQRQTGDRTMSKIVTTTVTIASPHPRPSLSVTVIKDFLLRSYYISKMLILTIPKGFMPQTKIVNWLLSGGISRTVSV